MTKNRRQATSDSHRLPRRGALGSQITEPPCTRPDESAGLAVKAGVLMNVALPEWVPGILADEVREDVVFAMTAATIERNTRRAPVHALRERLPPDVLAARDEISLSSGRNDYITPRPLDPLPYCGVASAVPGAALKTGVAHAPCPALYLS